MAEIMCSVQNSSSCGMPWEEYHASFLAIYRPTIIIALSSLTLFYARHWVNLEREKNTLERERQKFRRGFSSCCTLGYIFLIMFYILGNNITYDLSSWQGCMCVISLLAGSVFMFTAATFILIIAQQIYFATCDNKVRSLIVNSFKPVVLAVLPLVVTYFIIFTIALLGESPSVIPFSRWTYGVTSIPIANLGIQNYRYGKPVVRALRRTINSTVATQSGSMEEQIAKKASFFERNLYYSVVSCAAASVFFLAASLSEILYDPTVYLVLQTQVMLSFLIVGLTSIPLVGHHRVPGSTSKVGNLKGNGAETTCGSLTDGL